MNHCERLGGAGPWVAALVIVVLASGCAARAEPTIVDRVVEAYGGADAARPQGFQQVGRILSPIHPGVVGAVTRKSDGPSRLRVETTFPGQGTEVRIVDGEHGWRDGVEVGGPSLAAMALQAARLALPGLLAERRERVQDRGEVTSGGVRRHVLGLDLGQGRDLTIEVDPSTGYIVRTVGRAVASAAGPAIEFATDYGEFRTVDGRVFPFYECTTAMGRRTADITLASTELASSFATGTFAP